MAHKDVLGIKQAESMSLLRSYIDLMEDVAMSPWLNSVGAKQDSMPLVDADLAGPLHHCHIHKFRLEAVLEGIPTRQLNIFAYLMQLGVYMNGRRLNAQR